ncbi:MAG TPA: LysR family transcriptional regulator [Mycobacteriales bacterium]|nr:LysR family transcriptional regulator [Mycobacteriales bacterium]
MSLIVAINPDHDRTQSPTDRTDSANYPNPAEPLRPLRLDLVQTFVVVAEEHCLARAATRLYLSPSGVSRRIRVLESQLGRALVDRRTRALALTPTGALILPHAISLLASARRAFAQLDSPSPLRVVM